MTELFNNSPRPIHAIQVEWDVAQPRKVGGLVRKNEERCSGVKRSSSKPDEGEPGAASDARGDSESGTGETR